MKILAKVLIALGVIVIAVAVAGRLIGNPATVLTCYKTMSVLAYGDTLVLLGVAAIVTQDCCK